jgi:bifunctional enzyme CysN/CysC
LSPDGAAPAPAAAGDGALLRFVVCGSVDDGKSTLIGRLLYDSHSLASDQIAALERDSAGRAHGSEGLDFSLLVDGLAAEREQGITIDVAYRFFATKRRRFIVADTPGHEQYTRNMVTGASLADLAVILVDARKGVLTQTRRHTHLVSLMGVREAVLAVNKMDLVGWDEARFLEIAATYEALARDLGFARVTPIPVCAVDGENVARRGPSAPWRVGPTLLERLETAPPAARSDAAAPFRMPVQWISRGREVRGVAGMIAQGGVRPGQEVAILPAGTRARVARLLAPEGDLAAAAAGASVMLAFDGDVDCSRGDVLADPERPPETADQFEAHLVWMSEEPLMRGRSYLVKLGARTLAGSVTQIKHKIDVNTREEKPARQLALNEIGLVNLELASPVPFAPFTESRDLGGFILIDRQTNATLACGMIRFALRRANNIRWQSLDVDKEARAALLGQTPKVLWFTGLSGAGKSTIANLLERRLHAEGRATYVLDGDNLRHGLNRDLGFTERDRVENVRRAAEVAKLMADAGLIVICCFISPFRAERRMARALMAPGEFLEVFVDTPLAEAERRDVKGLYRKARAGEIKNFTGLDSPYEPPETPELRIDTTAASAEAAAEAILDLLLGRGL